MADPTKIVTKKARPKLGGSAASRWQKRQKTKGNCRACGQPRPAELANLCRVCQDKNNSYMKLYRKAKKVIPYVEGEFAEQIPVLSEKAEESMHQAFEEIEKAELAEFQKIAKEFGYEPVDRD